MKVDYGNVYSELCIDHLSSIRVCINYEWVINGLWCVLQADDKQRAVQYWAKIYNSMEVIQMSEDEIKSICSVLAAIYHLGVAGAVKGKVDAMLGQDL